MESAAVGEVGKVEGDWVSEGEGEDGEVRSVPIAGVAVSVSAIRPNKANTTTTNDDPREKVRESEKG